MAMTEIYRFRKIDDLFGKHQELEQQSIYFASPEKLNDPMEGFRDIFWRGDQIVWTNLFRHYLYCLHATFILSRVFGDKVKLEPKHVPVMCQMHQLLAPRGAKLFDDICKRVFEKARLNDYALKIAHTNRKSRSEEILFYLWSIHHIALIEVQNAYVEHSLIPESEHLPAKYSNLIIEKDYFGIMRQIEDERFLKVGFAVSQRLRSDRNLFHKYNFRSKPGCKFKENWQLVLLDFPQLYLKQLEQLLYPKWYAACFMKDFRNSSVWGHYGDNHKGVCLVFEADATTQGHSLTLNRVAIIESDREHWGPSPMTFHDINYEDRAGEIDFFRSMGNLPFGVLIDQWFKGDNGNYSECGSYFGPNNDEEAWRKDYWDKFYRDITIKAKDWEYEKESRLILHSMFRNLDEVCRRTLTYDFRSLKGIIFGINTPDAHKLKVIEIVHKKCQRHKRNDFELFQAYYCHESGGIEKHRIDFLEF